MVEWVILDHGESLRLSNLRGQQTLFCSQANSLGVKLGLKGGLDQQCFFFFKSHFDHILIHVHPF